MSLHENILHSLKSSLMISQMVIMMKPMSSELKLRPISACMCWLIDDYQEKFNDESTLAEPFDA